MNAHDELLRLAADALRECVEWMEVAEVRREDDAPPITQAKAAIAALAAPKEAGGGAGAEDVRRLQECESAWMAIVETLDERSPGWRGTTGRCMDHAVNAIRRLAAPSKEAGAEGLHPTHTVERAKRALGVAAPQADQQGASLEGDAVRGEEVAKILARHGYHAAAATVRRLASKASPDDQRQEASPPTEAAAAAGELQEEVWRASLNGGLPEHIRILLIRVYAALSPTASAAREGSEQSEQAGEFWPPAPKNGEADWTGYD